MQLTHEFTVPVPIDVAWDHFNDIASVAECFPGAQVTSVDGDTFTGSCKVKLGPIALVYNGSGTFTEKDESAHRMVVAAKGKDKRGNGTAGADVVMTMSSTGAGEGDQTSVQVVTELAITGKPAQFGRGVMQDVSDKLLGQFVACLGQRFEQPAEVADGSSADNQATATAGATATSEATDATGAEASAEAGAEAGSDGRTTNSATQPATQSGTRSAPRPAPPQDEALDLGATVLPVLLKSYWKQIVGGVVGVLVLRGVWKAVRHGGGSSGCACCGVRDADA